MKKFIATGAAALILLTGCSSTDGQFGKKTETFEDNFGRDCTAVKWGDSASVDCDYPPSENANGFEVEQ